MALTDADEKKFAEQLEAAGWRRRDFNGATAWTLRGFGDAFTLVEAYGYVARGWADQRLANLVKPWYADRSAIFTLLSALGGVGTVVINELVGSQNHTFSAVGMALATAAPVIGRYLHDQAQAQAAADIRKLPPEQLPGASPP